MKINKIVLLSAIAMVISITPTSAQFWKKIKLGKGKAESGEVVAPVVDSVVRYQPVETPAEPLEVEITEPMEADSTLSIDYNITSTYSVSQMDSLLGVWRTRQANDQFEEFQQHYIIADTPTPTSKIPDSVYIERLHSMVSPVHLPYNDVTKTYIERYTNTRYGTINRIMSLSQYYFPFIEEELTKNGIPVEFRAMPIIESALSATVTSRAGARGLWQFMPATAKAYGLEVNSLVDERCDPYLATKAACRFLKDMYSIYGDWTLVIASYNCGPGNVNKALARSGIDKDSGTFWDIYYFLPSETRGYVPAFVGASYAYAYHQQHNIEFEESPLPLATDTVHINRIMHLGQVSEVLELPIELLRELNPQYSKDIIPATTKEYPLRLPQQHVTEYIEREEMIIAKDSVYLKEFIRPENIEKAKSVPSGTIHKVKSGETLGAIARKYRVSTSAIIKWNNLKNPDRLSIGQKLIIEGR